MKLYGHTETTERPLTLREVTFSATPAELRQIARFLLHTADALEEADFDHAHLQDQSKWPRGAPDVVVVGPV